MKFKDHPAKNETKDVPPETKTYPAPFSLSVGAASAQQKPGLLQRMKTLISSKAEPPDLKTTDLPMYKLTPRGWNTKTEQWQLPIYPALDGNLRSIEDVDSSIHMWNLMNRPDLGKGPTVRVLSRLGLPIHRPHKGWGRPRRRKRRRNICHRRTYIRGGGRDPLRRQPPDTQQDEQC
jgi:hypothetical protein